MRISDWSSDVCSSDLAHELVNARLLRGLGLLARRLRLGAVSRDLASDQPRQLQRRHARTRHDALAADPLRDAGDALIGQHAVARRDMTRPVEAGAPLTETGVSADERRAGKE